MRLLKDILRPGSYQVRGRWVHFSREDLAELTDTVQRMLAAGLAIPFVLEHQAGALPLSDSDRKAVLCRGTVGWIEDATQRLDGTMVCTLDVPETADAKTVRACRYVSPCILTDFIDGLGHRWGRTVGHVAATPLPTPAAL